MSGGAISGRVLVVDADWDTLGSLARVLRGRGHQVVLATDGRSGLQRAVEVAADVVLVDENLSTLDVRTFLDVLRDNPRTAVSHAFVMGSGDHTHLTGLDPRTELLVKPFNTEEVAARVEEIIRARHEPKPEPELEGDLSQVAVFDLLQVFSVNRRTGKLRVEAAPSDGHVWVRDGHVVDASFGTAVGEKALYRVLALRSGRFVFAPDEQASRARIEASTDQLLMEAVRQTDEAAELEKELPARGAQVSLARRPASVSPVADALMGCLEEPRSIEELLDLVPATDLDVLQAVRELLEAGALLVVDAAGRQTRLCEPDEVAAMRAAALRLRRRGVDGPVRLGVVVSDAEEVTRLGRALASVREFTPASEPPATVGGVMVGVLGVLRLDGTELELFALPLEPSLRPLWGPVLAPATTVLSLVDPSEIDEALLRALDLSVVAAPPGWETPSGAVGAVRTALGSAAPQTPLPRGHGPRASAE